MIDKDGTEWRVLDPKDAVGFCWMWEYYHKKPITQRLAKAGAETPDVELIRTLIQDCEAGLLTWVVRFWTDCYRHRSWYLTTWRGKAVSLKQYDRDEKPYVVTIGGTDLCWTGLEKLLLVVATRAWNRKEWDEAEVRAEQYAKDWAEEQEAKKERAQWERDLAEQ